VLHPAERIKIWATVALLLFFRFQSAFYERTRRRRHNLPPHLPLPSPYGQMRGQVTPITLSAPKRARASLTLPSSCPRCRYQSAPGASNIDAIIDNKCCPRFPANGHQHLTCVQNRGVITVFQSQLKCANIAADKGLLKLRHQNDASSSFGGETRLRAPASHNDRLTL